MRVGRDENLMQAMNAAPELCAARRTSSLDLGEVARRLHANHPHRTVEEIEYRLRLVLLMRGMLLKETQSSTRSSAVFGKAIDNRQVGAASAL